MNKKLVAILIASLVLLSACAQSRLSENAPASPQYAPESVQEYGKNQSMAAMPAPEEPSAAADTIADGTANRLVVRTANLTVSVADPKVAMQAVANLSKTYNGYVVSSSTGNRNYNGSNYPTASITIRVNADKLDEVLEKIRALAVDSKTGVISENVTGEDVTSEYVDSESRLKNLQAAEKQLQKLLDSATDLEYTMDVFKQLTKIRGEIEVLQGHLKYLKESAALSAISVEFIPEIASKPIEIGGWKPEGIAKQALQALINGAQDLASFLIWFGIVWLPFLLPIGLIIWLIVRAICKARAKKLAAQQAQQQMYYYPQGSVTAGQAPAVPGQTSAQGTTAEEPKH